MLLFVERYKKLKELDFSARTLHVRREHSDRVNEQNHTMQEQLPEYFFFLHPPPQNLNLNENKNILPVMLGSKHLEELFCCIAKTEYNIWTRV